MKRFTEFLNPLFLGLMVVMMSIGSIVKSWPIVVVEMALMVAYFVVLYFCVGRSAPQPIKTGAKRGRKPKAKSEVLPVAVESLEKPLLF